MRTVSKAGCTTAPPRLVASIRAEPCVPSAAPAGTCRRATKLNVRNVGSGIGPEIGVALAGPAAPFAGVDGAIAPTLVDGAEMPLPLHAYCMRVLAGRTSAMVTPVIAEPVVLIVVMR